MKFKDIEPLSFVEPLKLKLQVEKKSYIYTWEERETSQAVFFPHRSRD